jgi:hypothetical protein
LVERLGPISGRPEDARLGQRHAVRLISEPAASSDFLPAPISLLEIDWHDDDALPFPLCLHDFEGTLASAARGNVVLADHGLSVSDPESTVPDDGAFLLPLNRPEVTQAALYDDNVARGATPGPDGLTTIRSATTAVCVDPSTALPAATVDGEGETWKPVRNLLDSGRFAAEFVAETDDAGLATLRFGDGILGREPRAGEVYVPSYRIGNGTAGNLGADALSMVVTTVSGVGAASNPLAAVGGTDPESVELVRQYAPAAFRVQERCVTASDYEEVTERHPEVAKAAATRRWTGSWQTMFVTVDRRGGKPVDAAFKEELLAFLDRFRLAGGDVEIEAPGFVPLDIELHVCAAAGYVTADVEREIYNRLANGITDAGTLGYFNPDRWTFGEPVYLNPLIAQVMAVPGVARVTPLIFHRWRQTDQGELALGRIEIGRLEIAQLDNDPSRPENGHLQLDVDGGT